MESDKQKIQILIELKKYDSAISNLEHLLQESPTNTGLLTLLGICFLRQHRYDEAKRVLSSGLELRPENYKMRYLYLLATSLSDYTNIDAELDKLENSEPNASEELLEVRIASIANQNKFANIFKLLKGKYPYDYQSTFLKCLFALKNVFDSKHLVAEKLLNSILEQDPEYNFAYSVKAFNLYYQGDTTKSITLARELLARKPGFVPYIDKLIKFSNAKNFRIGRSIMNILKLEANTKSGSNIRLLLFYSTPAIFFWLIVFFYSKEFIINTISAYFLWLYTIIFKDKIIQLLELNMFQLSKDEFKLSAKLSRSVLLNTLLVISGLSLICISNTIFISFLISALGFLLLIIGVRNMKLLNLELNRS